MSTDNPKPTPPDPNRRDGNLMVLNMVRKYWATSLATLLTVVIGVTFYTLGSKRIYEPETTIIFNPNPPRPLGRRVEQVVDMGSGNYWNNQEYYETQYKVMKSMRVAFAVVRDLGLHNDLRFLYDLAPGDPPPAKAEKSSPEEAARALRNRLTIRAVKDSRLASVRLRGADPQRTTRILGALVDTYVEQNLTQNLDSTNAASDWLRQQLDGLKTDLESSEMALHRYKKSKDILSIAFDDQSNMLREQIKFLNAELTRVRADLHRAAAKHSELRRAQTSDPTRITARELLDSGLLNSLRQTYEQAVRERNGLMGGGKGIKHPDVVAASRRIRRAQKAVLQETKNIQAAAGREVRVVSRHAAGLAGMLKKAKLSAHDLNLLEIEYKRLRRSKDNTEKLYSLVLERSKESDLARLLRVNNVRVLDRPLVPKHAVHPRVPLNIAAGLFAGLLLGIASAFLRGLLDRTLKVPDDIETDLNVTFLGILPQFDREAKGVADPAMKKRRRKRGRRIEITEKPELIVHEQPTSSIAEAARAIRTNLIFMRPDQPYETLLVTSPGPVEGKTTVATSIAIAMAQAGQRVLLMDCDLRRPRVHRVFGLGSETGITTALLSGKIADVVRDSGVPNMSIVPCGPVPPNPAELFHSDRFRELLAEARHEFDRVIIDSPPIAAVTDATILSTLVDGTVIVARAFETRKELARHAVRSIRDVGGHIAGAVLNAVDFARAEYKYSYYYYRRDDYYGSDAPRQSLAGPPSARDPQPPATH